MDKIGIILGSGLNIIADSFLNKILLFEDKSGIHHKKIFKIPYENSEFFIFQGRNHLYEKVDNERLLFNVKKAKKLGVKFLIISNAAGGLNINYKVGDLMIISSHINFLKWGLNIDRTYLKYDRNIISFIKKLAVRNKIKIHDGIYCSSTGPIYETKAEINILKKFSVDAVGMSTIPEILYASKSGIKFVAISYISNILNTSVLSITHHEEVLKAGKFASKNFSELVTSLIKEKFNDN